MLSRFEISGFRAFSHLEVPNLGLVNLLVGKNGIGKSSLLEALQVHASGGSLSVLQSILTGRDEYARETPTRKRLLEIDAIFHKDDFGRSSHEIRICPGRQGEESELRISRVAVHPVQVGPDEGPGGYRWEEAKGDVGLETDIERALAIDDGGERRLVLYQRIADERIPPWRLVEPEPVFVPARGVPSEKVALWWDAVSLRESEKWIVDCLRPFAPIEKISFVENPRGRGRRPIVKLDGSSEPVSLRSLGDGIVHMFQIALALAFTARDASARQPTLFLTESPSYLPLLIDEFENGIHYSLHEKMWSFVFRIAMVHRLQVFATTHSWDCIEGFQKAADADAESQGVLIRIERIRDRCRAVTFTGRELQTVTRESIEVR